MDISEGPDSFVIKEGVCDGANLKLCMKISHDELRPDRHPPICKVCFSSIMIFPNNSLKVDIIIVSFSSD